MEKFRNAEMQTAYENGGYREQFAMTNGNKAEIYVNGHKCLSLHIHYGKSIRMQMELLMTQLQKVGLIRKAG